LFVTRRIKPQRIYREIDWSLLLLFVGLFVVVAALERAVLTPERLAHVRDLPLNQTLVLALITAVLSNLVSNVPAVLVLKPLIAHLADPRHSWLVLGMASTLAGNFTILGSVANLIVVQGAERRGVKIGFWTYFLIGAPVTLISLALGILWLSL
jgi:Na+/H+ antiporter NhaD/arsenite permease-like protein